MSSYAERPIPLHGSSYACIDLVNSRFCDHLGRSGVIDRLASTEWRTWFLDRYGLVVAGIDIAPMADLRQLRGDIGGVLDLWREGRPVGRRQVAKLDAWTSRSLLRQRTRLTSDGLELVCEAVTRDWNWVQATVSSETVELIATGDRFRLKRCANPDCSWMYYDTSLNRSKRYCSTTPCAALMRTRRYRARLG